MLPRPQLTAAAGAAALPAAASRRDQTPAGCCCGRGAAAGRAGERGPAAARAGHAAVRAQAVAAALCVAVTAPEAATAHAGAAAKGPAAAARSLFAAAETLVGVARGPCVVASSLSWAAGQGRPGGQAAGLATVRCGAMAAAAAGRRRPAPSAVVAALVGLGWSCVPAEQAAGLIGVSRGAGRQGEAGGRGGAHRRASHLLELGRQLAILHQDLPALQAVVLRHTRVGLHERKGGGAGRATTYSAHTNKHKCAAIVACCCPHWRCITCQAMPGRASPLPVCRSLINLAVTMRHIARAVWHAPCPRCPSGAPRAVGALWQATGGPDDRGSCRQCAK